MANEEPGEKALSPVEIERAATEGLTDYDYTLYLQAYATAVCGGDGAGLFGIYANQYPAPGSLIALGAFDGATHREPRSRAEVTAERERLVGAKRSG